VAKKHNEHRPLPEIGKSYRASVEIGQLEWWRLIGDQGWPLFSRVHGRLLVRLT